MDDTWSRNQVLPSLFKSEPAQITLRPLLAPGLHRSPLLRAQSDLHQHQHQHQQQSYQYQQQQQQQSHALLPPPSSTPYSHQHYTHGALASHQNDAVPIKMEPDTTSSYDYHHYQHTHQSVQSHYQHQQPQQQQQQQQQRTSLPVLADMLRGARPARPQCEMTTPVATPPAGADTTPKSALSFILGEAHAMTTTAAANANASELESQEMYRASASSASSFMSEDDELTMNPYADQHQHDTMGLPQTAAQQARESKLARLKVASKRRAARPASRTCKFDGCDQYVVDHGLCVRHGGGKRCLTDGCTSRAKHFGRCWRHGGSMECKITDCVNRAKSRGFCWSHGGGTKCKAEPCEKIAISNGLCWAHGGGKRCVVDGCMKQAYERTQNYCNSHFQQWKQSGEHTQQ